MTMPDLRSAAVLAALVTGVRPIQAEGTATFSGSVVLSSEAAGPYPFMMHVDKWTSAKERRRLAGVLESRGREVFLKELRNKRVGYVVLPTGLRKTSWPLIMATTEDTPQGRMVHLLTARPITLRAVDAGGGSEDDEFGAVEFSLDARGVGQGAVISTATLSLAADGRLGIEALAEAPGPHKLVGVRRHNERTPPFPVGPTGKERVSEQP